MKLLDRTDRNGFTLIELLVVIGIILVLATLALMIVPRLSDDQRIARGSDMISGWLLIQKQRAHRDQVPRGIRLVPSADNPLFVTEMNYIEQPEDWKGGASVVIQIPSPMAVPPYRPVGVNPLATAFIPNKDLVNEGVVGPGDFLFLDAHEQIPLSGHRIFAAWFVTTPGGVPGTHLLFGSADGLTNRPAGGPVNASGNNWRIVRQPRVMVGEPPLLLPRDVVIDLSPAMIDSRTGLATDSGISQLPGASLDILFSSRGQVIGANALGGKIILRMRNGTREPNDGDQLLIAIYTRTGLIASHPVNVDPPPPSPLHDPYLFLRDGKNSNTGM